MPEKPKNQLVRVGDGVNSAADGQALFLSLPAAVHVGDREAKKRDDCSPGVVSSSLIVDGTQDKSGFLSFMVFPSMIVYCIYTSSFLLLPLCSGLEQRRDVDRWRWLT